MSRYKKNKEKAIEEKKRKGKTETFYLYRLLGPELHRGRRQQSKPHTRRRGMTIPEIVPRKSINGAKKNTKKRGGGLIITKDSKRKTTSISSFMKEFATSVSQYGKNLVALEILEE